MRTCPARLGLLLGSAGLVLHKAGCDGSASPLAAGDGGDVAGPADSRSGDAVAGDALDMATDSAASDSASDGLSPGDTGDGVGGGPPPPSPGRIDCGSMSCLASTQICCVGFAMGTVSVRRSNRQVERNEKVQQ